MRQVAGKDFLLKYIEDVVESFENSLLEIHTKFYNEYNYEEEKIDEFTLMGIKGHLRSRQEEDMVVSKMWFEYAILKEPYSERKEAHEVHWQAILDQEISYKDTIRQLERKFDIITEKINKFDFFALEDHAYDFLAQHLAEIEIDVKVGSKTFYRSNKLNK